MKFLRFLAVCLGLAALTANSPAQETISDVFADPALDLNRPADRARAVERIRVIENTRREEALAMARQKGWAIRGVTPDNRTFELIKLDADGNPTYAITHNHEAAISTAANLVRNTAPYNLSGDGMIVGLWDGGWVRQDHQEFVSPSRVVRLGSASTNDNHATHVAGTIGAKGHEIAAQGMAPNVTLHSYHWDKVIAEMNAAAATAAGQTAKLYISNHSWGFVSGWATGNWSGTSGRHWFAGTNREDPAYGRYTVDARDWDLVAFNAPYFLIVHSAGNDRNSTAPATGTTYYYRNTNNVWVSKAYDPATDPYNVGWKGGFNTISHFSNAKNLMVVGAVNDAVNGSSRDITRATMSNFSGWGPTDDGRIKPDIVANGVGVYSPIASTNISTYASYNGTSMSSPNAAGSAALLVEQYRKLFPGEDMLASTLKGLIIHTADDLGRPGPDYTFGWGLMNTKGSADLIIDHHANPEQNRMVEGQLATAVPSQTYTLTWDGISPIRATLCWTDPAAASIATLNDTSSRLVNDLDLKLIAPDGTQHYPYVMPFVGTWTIASMSENATTGVNSTDNVEQVLIQNPGQSGQWTVKVTHKGNLTNNQQNYSLLTSGLSAAPLSMEVARGGSVINVGGADGVSGATAGSGTQITYSISNVGGGQLELTTPVTISGQQNCSVTVNTQPASPVNGGASTNLVTTVTPIAEGTWSFNISISNNDPDKNPYHWTITGIAGSSATISLISVADTYINAAATGTNYGSETIFSIWNRGAGNPGNFRYGFVRFDLSSIPGGTTITSATLDFVQNNTVSGSVDIYEATGAWTEGGATWNNSNTLVGSTLYGTANAPGTAGAAVPSINLNASGLTKIQNWINTPSGNHGFSVKTANNGNNANIDLRSREHATPAHHPRLTVTHGGGAVEAPLMIVSGSDGVVTNGGSDSIPGTQAGVGTQLTYAIANLGSANLTMTTPVTATPVSNCLITVNTQPSSAVAPSGNTNLLLTVTPSGAGNWSATVSIANNDADKNPYTWTISGSAFGSHTVTYNGNNSDSGTAPVDGNSPYFEGSTVTVLGNTGNLTKTGFTFAGWNTAANGSGTTYAPGAAFTMPGSGVTLHAVWNAPPLVNAGPDQNIFLTASSWSPLTLSPGLWLDAADDATVTLNGATVSQWADKSTFNRHATATGTAQPTATAAGLNGKRVLTFDGGSDVLNVDLDFLAGVSHSAFIVTNPTIFSNIYGAANGSQAANSLHVGFNGANYRMNFWSNDFGPARSANFVAGSANIVNYIWTTGTGKQILANGKSEGTNANAGVIGTMSGGGRIGRATGHPFFGGDIAEIIIITGTVTAQSRQEIEGYLAHKWGLAANLPIGHPYKTTPPDGASATTTLAGSASDVENDPVTTMWSQVGGPSAANFVDASVKNTTVTFLQEGIYTLRLTANDGFGSTFDEVIITVTPPLVTRTLTYNGNGNTSGTAPVDPLSPYVDGSNVTVLGAGTLAKTGHTYTGWNTSADGSGTPYAPGVTFTINANTTLHAQWTANTYTLTFDPNGGSTPVPTSKDVTFDSTYGTLASVSRTGYSFDGWFTAASEGIQVTDATTVSTAANHILHAQWILTPVSVVTDLDTVHISEGGTEIFQVKLSDQPAEGVTVAVSRTSGDTDITVQSGGILSFTTANWDTYQTVTLAAAVDADAANGTAMITCTPNDANYSSAVVTAIEIDKDATLTVTNDGNGTTEPSGAVIVEKGAATPITANTPVSHNFVNWTVISGFATFANASATTTATISADATVQANFAIKQYTLAYSAGTGGTIDGISPQTVNHGASGTVVTAVPNTGYSFVKWSDDVATPARTDTGATEDITVTAEFSANPYEVTFNANGGDAPTPPSIEVTFDAAYGILAPATRTGYSFDGWFTAASGGTEVTESTTVATASNHTLYAQWTANTYIITFDPNGGDAPSPASKEVTFDAAYGSLETVSRSGYTFDGWFTAASGGTEVTESTTVATASNHTLYAQWIQGGALAVTSGVFESSGTFGGTFSPSSKQYTLENTGGESIDWTAAKTASWLGLSATSGTLAAGATTTVTLTINATADDLTPDTYFDTITFTNTTNNNGDTTRGVNLTVISIYDDWASGYPGFVNTEPGENPDHDSLTNLQEFAFGTDPTVGVLGPIEYLPGGSVTKPGTPVAQNIAVGGGVEFRAVFGRRKDFLTAGLSYTVHFSADLKKWLISADVPTVLTNPDGEGVIEAVGVPYPESVPLDGGGFAPPKFLRIGVSMD